MSKTVRRLLHAAFAFPLFLLPASCSRPLGYSVLLWSDAEHNLEDGQIVKVHIKSNIFHEYVVTAPGSDDKFELPDWQLTAPERKSKAAARARRFAEFEHVYALVKLDGLPVRAETVNTSKQVYRLRKDEIIRVLYRGNGQSVTNGSGEMEGEWLRVLTESGTQGWCFSHNLDLFTAGVDVKSSVRTAAAEVAAEPADEVLDNALKKRWYPESFSAMMKSGRIDLEKMDPSFGFDFGGAEGRATLRTAEDDFSWDFSGISKLYGRQYQLDGTKVSVTIRDDDSITVQFFDANRKMRAVNFVAFGDDFDLQAVIGAEEARRREVIGQIAAAGPRFVSPSYGTLLFSGDGRATWFGNDVLVRQGIIDAAHATNARVSAEYFMASALAPLYDGVLTFRFGGGSEANFFYKLADGGLRLEDASRAERRDGEKLITSSWPGALIMFFEPER